MTARLLINNQSVLSFLTDSLIIFCHIICKTIEFKRQILPLGIGGRTPLLDPPRELVRRLIFIIWSPNDLSGWSYIYIFSGGRDLVFVVSIRQVSVRLNFKLVKGWGLCPSRFHVLLSHNELTRTCCCSCTGHWRIHAGCLTMARNIGKEH